MPLPLLFIVPAVVTGMAGAQKTTKSLMDSHEANKITNDANARVDTAKKTLERSRDACATSLARLGDEKLFVLGSSIGRFIDSFERIKNIELTDSVGLEELKKLHVDKESFNELKEMRQFAATVAAGASAGIAGGALTAFGAYGAAATLATASTGTAIASLSGAAATNATMAFFGGGSIAAGGLGVAGGAMVLGGIVAGPALLVMGLITSKKSEQKLEIAKGNSAQADEIVAELRNAWFQCDAIRRRTYMFYCFLARLDARFLPLIFKMEEILATEGEDYSLYSPESKKVILEAATTAGSIKALLDTPILTEQGSLTKESMRLMESMGVEFGARQA
ncbi:MAG: hypothetical protein WAY93_10015 [Atopobiaceae bacterium]|jgi:hypothetical protein|nr:hypothetical protein [Atopobiaceae bacterium]